MPRSLTARQQRFVDAYLVSRNATQAAREAGYSPERARCTGSELLHRVHIVAALRARGLDPPRGLHPATQRRKPMVRRPRGEINPLEERFALAYLVTGNAAEAARRAGLKVARAAIGGCKMLKRPHVAAFIEAERTASIERTRIDVDRVRREFARIAFTDIADFMEWDEAGNIALKASAAISPDDRAAIAELKVKRGEQGVNARLKLHDKLRALDRLARLMGLYGKKSFVTIDHEQERRDANEILRERLMKIVARGEKKE
ncbi:MAG TPA: terminase small subunit [Stellaceae bacterium]|jgi:phage terminase small subunit|nr:terminase small subunit [Stellaceae bacterium]